MPSFCGGVVPCRTLAPVLTATHSTATVSGTVLPYWDCCLSSARRVSEEIGKSGLGQLRLWLLLSGGQCARRVAPLRWAVDTLVRAGVKGSASSIGSNSLMKLQRRTKCDKVNCAQRMEGSGKFARWRKKLRESSSVVPEAKQQEKEGDVQGYARESLANNNSVGLTTECAALVKMSARGQDLVKTSTSMFWLCHQKKMQKTVNLRSGCPAFPQPTTEKSSPRAWPCNL